MTLRPSKRRTFYLACCLNCGTYYQVCSVVDAVGRIWDVRCQCGGYLRVDRKTLEAVGCKVELKYLKGSYVLEKVSPNHQKGDGVS